jgi:hypothetical protein
MKFHVQLENSQIGQAKVSEQYLKGKEPSRKRVIVPARQAILASGQIFKDDVNGFSSTSDIYFMLGIYGIC